MDMYLLNMLGSKGCAIDMIPYPLVIGMRGETIGEEMRGDERRVVGER
jgi:hypothetical protein